MTVYICGTIFVTSVICSLIVAGAWRSVRLKELDEREVEGSDRLTMFLLPGEEAGIVRMRKTRERIAAHFEEREPREIELEFDAAGRLVITPAEKAQVLRVRTMTHEEIEEIDALVDEHLRKRQERQDNDGD